MNPIDLADVTRYVEDNIASFHARRIQKLMGSSLRDILKRKNLYLFKARNILSKEEYHKYCGQRFWEFIIVNKFTHEFADDFCDDGRINWEALVAYNSAAQR